MLVINSKRLLNVIKEWDTAWISCAQGDTLIFSYKRRLGSFFGFKNLNINIFGGFQKNDYFRGMKILWIFFAVITKLDYI